MTGLKGGGRRGWVPVFRKDCFIPSGFSGAKAIGFRHQLGKLTIKDDGVDKRDEKPELLSCFEQSGTISQVGAKGSGLTKLKFGLKGQSQVS